MLASGAGEEGVGEKLSSTSSVFSCIIVRNDGREDARIDGDKEVGVVTEDGVENDIDGMDVAVSASGDDVDMGTVCAKVIMGGIDASEVDGGTNVEIMGGAKEDVCVEDGGVIDGSGDEVGGVKVGV